MRIKAPADVRPANVSDLEQVILFQHVALETLTTLVHHCRICQIDRRQELCLDRREGRFVYVIRRGYVAIRSQTQTLSWDNFLAWRGPGQVLGEMELLSQKPIIPIIKATDPCELLEIRAKPFLETANTNPYIYRNVARLIIQKNTQEWQRSEVIQIPLSSAMRRVARTLIILVEARGYVPETQFIDGFIRQIDIAGYIGTRRETVMENMAELKAAGIIHYRDNKPASRIQRENGIIEIEEGRIEILDEERLRNEM